MPSDREMLQDRICEFVGEQPWFDAPILTAIDSSKKFRTVRFGIREELNVEVRIYSGRFFLLKWSAESHTIPAMGQERLDSVEQVETFIQKNFLK